MTTKIIEQIGGYEIQLRTSDLDGAVYRVFALPFDEDDAPVFTSRELESARGWAQKRSVAPGQLWTWRWIANDQERWHTCRIERRATTGSAWVATVVESGSAATVGEEMVIPEREFASDDETRVSLAA